MNFTHDSSSHQFTPHHCDIEQKEPSVIFFARVAVKMIVFTTFTRPMLGLPVVPEFKSVSMSMSK